jgi:hypothetical protein
MEMLDQPDRAGGDSWKRLTLFASLIVIGVIYVYLHRASLHVFIETLRHAS